MTMREIDKELADLIRKAQSQGLIINTYSLDEGCPPCGTLPEEETCFLCPYRLAEQGINTRDL